MKSVTLADFEDNLITIPLDEKLDGKGNGRNISINIANFLPVRNTSMTELSLLEKI